nr:RNA-binding domain-containing protein [Cohnella xylanilytica]
MVGFANADGGELLVGVEDNGEVTGVPHSDKTIHQLLQAPNQYVHKDTPLPNSYIAQNVTIDGQTVLYFYVDKGTEYFHLTSEGKCLQRKDRETVPVPVEKLKFERQEQISREYDRHFVYGAYVQHLDIDLMVEVSSKVARGFSPEKLLQYFDLAEPDVGGLRVRRAALLLFAKDVKVWHPRCSVRVVRVRGNELKPGREYNATSDEIETDNIITLLKTAWIKIRPHLTETRLFEDGLFKESTMYPEDAVFEALLNALAHRDYSIEGRGIEIFIYDNRMEIQSPGGLLSSVTIEDIKNLRVPTNQGMQK